MKILHAINFMDKSMGGPPVVVNNLVAQQANDHELIVASYSDPSTFEPPDESSNCRYVEIAPFDLSETVLGSHSKRIFSDILNDCDVLHMHCMWEPLLLSAAKCAHSMDIPYVITPHGMLDPWCMGQKPFKKRMALKIGRRWMLENAKFIHVLNEEEEQGIRKLGIKNRCQIIPNGVTIEEIDPHLKREPISEAFPELKGNPFVLFLSRLHYKKGLDILADVASIFFKSFPEWNLVVAGPDDGAQKEFEQKIKSHGIEENIRLVGPIYGNLKYSLLANCEIFCLPSRQEGFSVAILEAMAASRPVSITEHCHFDRVAETESGFVDSLESRSIAGSLCRLAESKTLRTQMGKNGRRLLEAEYTWKKVNNAMINSYRN